MRLYNLFKRGRSASGSAHRSWHRPQLEMLEDRVVPSITGGTTVIGTSPSTTTVTSSANPSIVGRSVTFTATVAPSSFGFFFGFGTPTGTVQFQIDNSNVGDPVNLTTTTGGQATASFSTNFFLPGTHTVTAQYSGDSTFAPSNGSLAGGQTVNFFAPTGVTTTIVSSSLNPSAPGQAVTFTATITGFGIATPTGTVQFFIDNANAGSPVPVTTSGGMTTASYTTSSLTSGIHIVLARYSGDSNFGSSIGVLPTPQTVAMSNSTTSVSSSNNPSAPGQAVTFTATVTANSSSFAAPTGIVQFVIDGASVGASALVSGFGGVSTASYTTSSLAVGTHSVMAVYSGDARFAASSASLAGGQTVGNGSGGGGGGGGGGPGNVLINLNPFTGVLRITGYSGDNAISIQGSSGGLQVAGNGSSSSATFPLSSVREIDLSLLNGNENVTMGNFNISGNVSINAGSGSDNFSLSAIQANLINISVAGPGADTVTLNNASAGSANITAGDNASLSLNGVIAASSVNLTAQNNATIVVNNLAATGDLDITVGDNTQSVSVKGSTANNVSIIQTGSTGSPLFDLENDTIRHNLNLTAGGGNNRLVFSHLQVATDLIVALGGGKNSLSAGNVTAMFGSINGGSGASNTYANGGGNSGFSVFGFSTV